VAHPCVHRFWYTALNVPILRSHRKCSPFKHPVWMAPSLKTVPFHCCTGLRRHGVRHLLAPSLGEAVPGLKWARAPGHSCSVLHHSDTGYSAISVIAIQLIASNQLKTAASLYQYK
jgi:hypothetical protein